MKVKSIGHYMSNLIRNAYVFSIISRCISVVMVFAYTALRSRYFQPELQGESAVITEYIELFTLIVCLGIHEAYPFYKKNQRSNVLNEFVGVVLGMFFVYALISFFIILGRNLGYRFNTIVISIPLAFLLKELNYVLLIEAPQKYNITLLFLDVVDILVVIGLMLFVKADLFVLLLYLISRRLIYLIIIISVLKINIRKIEISLMNIRKYIKYGMLPMITIIMMEINYKADIIMLEIFGIEDAMIGVYSLGVSLSQRIWLIPDAMKDILTSRLTQKASCEEVAMVSRISIISISAISFVFILIGSQLINLFFGEVYSYAYVIVLWLLIGVFGMVFYKMIYAYNLINGRKGKNLVLLTCAAISNILLNLILIPLYGIKGAAIASSASYLVCGIAFIIDFSKNTNIPVYRMVFINKSDVAYLKKFARRRKGE